MKWVVIAIVAGLVAAIIIILDVLFGYNELKFNFYVDPSFRGKLIAIEDPTLKLDYGRVYDLRPKGDTVTVPQGFLTGKQPVFWRTKATFDLKGNLLSKGDNPPDGKVGIRALVGYSEPDHKGGSRQYQAFLVTDKYLPRWSGDKGDASP